MLRFARYALPALYAAVFFGSVVHGATAETFILLTARQIRDRIVGHAIAEEIGRHWTFGFWHDGLLDLLEMGTRSKGRWEIQEDRLCFAGPNENLSCYEAWISGSRVRLRRSGMLDLEGTIERLMRE